ncbi:MAG: DUF1592 domain-containing protein [Planctomycetota bacterium]|nr:DUF1592 domain-containing protein [Planctomycetota bacterium]
MRSLPSLRRAALLACALVGAPAVGAWAERPTAASAVRPDDALPERARAFLDAHCVACHGPEAQQGDLRLDGEHAPAPGGEDGALDWEYLHERVVFDEMPPPAAPAPSNVERAEFLEWLGGALGVDAPEAKPAPPVPLRRLTREEWRHAARDLFGVEFDPEAHLPEDAVGHGFDHVAEAQTLSEVDFVRFLDAAEAIAERAVPLGEPSPPRTVRYGPGDINADKRRDAAWLFTRGVARARTSVPSAGEYVVRASVWGQQAGPEPCRVRLVLGGSRSSEVFDVRASDPAEAVVVEARIEAKRGGDLGVGVEFLNDFFNSRAREGKPKDRNLAIRWIEVEGPFGAATSTEFSEGLLARAADAGRGERGLRVAVGELAATVWRLPDETASRRDVARLLALTGKRDEAELRLRMALTAALASPRFLFMEERGGRGRRGEGVALTGVERATRLASMLWRSVPDAELLETARSGELDTPEGASTVARRMLADPRASRFAASFGRQWLQLDGLRGKRADRKRFPDFDGRLARSMVEETQRVLLDSLRERRSMWDLVDGTTTFVDERLAKHYGLSARAGEPVDGGWRRVDLSETERRGLLGHGSVLFLTSEPERTSPVKRGKWVLDVLLGAAPPPPPPGVDSLPEDGSVTGEDGEELSLRERFELHRADPSCAACHARMDPIGFGLEAYDAVGALREGVDATGELPDGRTFNGPAELADVLRSEGRFLEATVERLLVYGLARSLVPADRATVAEVVAALEPDHPTLEDALLAIVSSDAFLRIPSDD